MKTYAVWALSLVISVGFLATKHDPFNYCWVAANACGFLWSLANWHLQEIARVMKS